MSDPRACARIDRVAPYGSTERLDKTNDRGQPAARDRFGSSGLRLAFAGGALLAGLAVGLSGPLFICAFAVVPVCGPTGGGLAFILALLLTIGSVIFGRRSGLFAMSGGFAVGIIAGAWLAPVLGVG